MNKKLKKEASVAGNVKGFMQGGVGMVRRKKSDKANHPFDEKIGDPISDPDLFETVVIASQLANKNMSETVRKRGQNCAEQVDRAIPRPWGDVPFADKPRRPSTAPTTPRE